MKTDSFPERKTAGQKMFEVIYPAGSWQGFKSNVEAQSIIDGYEQAAKTTYEDDPKPMTAVRKVASALSVVGYFLTQTESLSVANALNIHDELPEGELLPCPVCGASYQQANHAANAAIRELSK